MGPPSQSRATYNNYCWFKQLRQVLINFIWVGEGGRFILYNTSAKFVCKGKKKRERGLIMTARVAYRTGL